tara:strand:- start:10144 stop:10710 length:567 start_codon:yes stop_codon:yes gene_type:complete
MKVLISKSGEVSKPFIERIHLIQGDITQQDTDAIAMLIPQDMEFAGQINQSIMQAAGYDIDAFILEHIYKPRVGEVYALPAGNLNAKHILVGIMPYYRTEFDQNDSHLSGAVRSIMELARCMLLTSISFPPLFSGKKGFAKPKAARLVCQGINDRMQDAFEDVRIVCSDEASIEIFDRKLRILGWDGG